MLKQFIAIVLISILISANLKAQLKLNIVTDKSSYSSGEPIIIKCIVKNNSNNTIKVTAGCTNAGQAEFYFNDFFSRLWETCDLTTEELIYPPNSSRTYSWFFDPIRYGFPSSSGKQRLIGTYFNGLRDTTYISCEKVRGGWIEVGFLPKVDSSLSKMKDSLKIGVLDRNVYSYGIIERWQLRNVNYDSLYTVFSKDKRFTSVQHFYWKNFDSVIFTAIADNIKLPNSYFLSQNFPNPFNPSTTIKYSIPNNQFVTMKIFDMLGREITTLVNENKAAGNYEVKFDGGNLSSGIYFYRITTSQGMITKKMILMR